METIETLCAKELIEKITKDKEFKNYELINNKYNTYLGVILHFRKEQRVFNIELFDNVNKIYSEYLEGLNGK